MQDPLPNQIAGVQGGYRQTVKRQENSFQAYREYGGYAIGRVRPSYRVDDAPVRGRIPSPSPEAPQGEPIPQPPAETELVAAYTGNVEQNTPISIDQAAPSLRMASNLRQGAMPVGYNNYQELIRTLTGRYVIADFLIGSTIQRRSGIIKHVGAGYIVLHNPCTQAETGCDLLALRFLTVLPEGTMPNDTDCALRKFDRL